MDTEREGRRLRGRRRWLRVAAAAEMLEVSEHTLRRWADAGVIPCRRTPSGQRQFLPGDLQRFLERCGAGGNGHADGGALAAVSRAAARTEDPMEALAQVARALAGEPGVDRCLVMEHDGALDALVGLASAGATPAAADDAPPAEDPAAGEVWLLVERPAEREMLRGGEPLRGPSRLCIPFAIGATANGCLVLQGPGAGRLSPGRLEHARDLGDLAALAVHRLQAARDRAAQAARMESLLHAGRSMTSSLVLQDVLDAVAREVVDTFAARYCVIWEYAEDQDALIERAGFGVDPGFCVDGETVMLEERSKEREILFGPEPVLETVSDPELDPQSRVSMERWGEKTCLSLPLQFGGATLGLLAICETERERRFTGEEMELARGLANQASAAVHNARMYRDLEQRNEELVARARRERLLNELSLKLGSSLDLREVLDSACRRICSILDAGGCEIWARREA
ncbi:MAG TPA: GAF domain-containing protein, partial [Thermoleophilia bacterium]|nr:GAF domain-containing protein [Thermoleophilia bacterium]